MMFFHLRTALAASLLISMMVLISGQAQAQQVRAEVTTNLNQRAGPGTRFPVLVTIPSGSTVTLFGCLSDFSWCDGVYRGDRGWFSGNYLRIPYDGTRLAVATYSRYDYLPAVSFSINTYWDRYYRDRPFYGRLSFYSDGGSISVSVGSFYRPLEPYGRWTEVRGRYVWVPDVGPGWHPYTEGHWVYTRRYGWTWVSHEPHGWATHHYGRWAYSPRIGWFWIPGTRWAPAWVAWRRSDDHLSWAPLPPDPQDRFGFSIDVSFGNIPNYYWRSVPAREFQSQNISNVVIGDNNTIINIINQSEPAGTVNIVNNVVVNNVIDVDYVEQQTGETVVARELALTSTKQEDGEVKEETLELYHPSESELEPAEQPDEVASEEEIAEVSATAGQAGDEPTTEELVPPAPEAGETPPQGTEQTVAPPLLAEGEEPTGAPAEEAAPPAEETAPEQLPEGVEVCPEGTVRQEDGSCGEPPAAPPPAEEVTPETPAEAPEEQQQAPEPQPQQQAPEPQPQQQAPEPQPQQQAPEPQPQQQAPEPQPQQQAPEPQPQQQAPEPQPQQQAPEGQPSAEPQQPAGACPQGQRPNPEGACVPQ